MSLKEFLGESEPAPLVAAEEERRAAPSLPGDPRIIPRTGHEVSRQQISQAALKVLYGLKDAGHQAYLVGGGVRDLLLGREPKDFDVVTDAHPETVRRIFRNSRLIGRRFILVHVHFHGEIVEVATFRGSGAPALTGEENAEEGDEAAAEKIIQDGNGRLLADNIYGSLEEDVFRRDFSVNALYYNIADFSIVDYTGGLDDLRAGQLRIIGDPDSRYREDPVRMLRAMRFAAKLGFRLEASTEAPIPRLGHLLEDVPPARLFDESLKLFLSGYAVQSYTLLRHYGLFKHLFPATDEVLGQEADGFPRVMLRQALDNTDQRVLAGKPVTPAFLFAAMLWEPVRQRLTAALHAGMNEMTAMHQAAGDVIQSQVRRIAIPKRFSLPMREIWELQLRFHRRQGRRPFTFAAHPRFRAAYDFFLLRAAAGEADSELAQWWTDFQGAAEPERLQMIREVRQEASEAPGDEAAVAEEGAVRKPRRRRRRRPRKETDPT